MNKFLLAGDEFMSGIHLKHSRFTYNACGPFTKNKERIETFMKTGNTQFIYKDNLDEACFQHEMIYGESKDLARTPQSDKTLRDKAFEIASNLKYDGYQRRLASNPLTIFPV